nr:hypothetical protein [Microbacterium sp.]
MERRIEQRVEGLARFRIHDAAAVIQLVDVDAVEECLVADASERVVNAHVDRVHVAGERQAVFQVCLGLVVLDLAGVDARVEERESAGDAVLFLFEQIQWHGSGVVGVQQAAPFLAELVALRSEGVSFGLARCVEVIELAGEHVPQRGDDVLGNLHALVVVLDLLLNVVDRHGLAGAGRPLGVPAGAHEVRVDVAVAVLGVGHHEPGAAVPAVDRAFQVVLVGLRLLT